MKPIENLIRQDLLDFATYQSAPRSNNQSALYLNANESPFVSSKAALNRYPEKQSKRLLARVAKYYQTSQNQILLTRGSDEGIDLLIRLLCQAGKDKIFYCPPTFGMYKVAAKLQGTEVVEIPLLKNSFELDMSAITAVKDPSIKIIFLCSPNNPTGNLFKKQEILNLCKYFKDQALVVVDEAYIEYSESNSLCQLVSTTPNLVVLRTFSKAFGLAASRIGTVTADPRLINWLYNILPPYPLADASVNQAYDALSNDAIKKMRANIQLLCQNRNELVSKLRQLPIVKFTWPSSVNFILIEFSLPVIQKLAEQKIYIRDLSAVFNQRYIARISIGTKSQNQQLLTALRNL